MGRDGLVIAAVCGVLCVLAIWRWPDAFLSALEWPRRYVRARGYEAELARHTAAAVALELEGRPPDATYATVAYAPVRGRPPWGPLTGQWLSELEANGEPVPAWARPDADRYSGYGANSGSSGSDYHGGELSAAAEGGAPGSSATGGPGSEPYGVTGPVPPSPFAVPEPTPEAWVRLLKAWGDDVSSLESSAGIPQPARDPDSGAVERGREDDGSTGTATREQWLGSPASASSTGAGGAVPVTPGSAPGPRDAAAVASPGPGSTRLATRFDVELAAECARYIREQNRDVGAYLERLERRIGVRQ